MWIVGFFLGGKFGHSAVEYEWVRPNNYYRRKFKNLISDNMDSWKADRVVKKKMQKRKKIEDKSYTRVKC